MTPKEKAEDLIEKFTDPTKVPNLVKNIWVEDIDSAKHCALIAVNEVLNTVFQHHKIDFWKQVREEVKKL